MTTQEAAAYLGVSASLICRRIREGALTATKLQEQRGHVWLLRRADLDKYRAARAQVNEGRRGKRGRPFR